MTPAAAALVLIFVGLSGIHWYWAFGGKLSVAGVPEVGGRPVFTPGPVTTVAVATLLMVAAFVSASQAELLGLERSGASRVGVASLAVLFLLRAVGDLRLVGFFKSVRRTPFGRMDTWVYSPLCVVVFVFLQNFRATLIPLLAVPVSLIGALVAFPLLGFSINTLSLLGLVLAIGTVVDDAIVVVEAVSAKIESGHAAP